MFQLTNSVPDRQDNVSLRRSSRKVGRPAKLSDFHIDTKIKWVEAINFEIEVVNRNNTWVITELPYGRKAIGCKRVFKVKYKSTDEVERFKARLVAKGYNQKERIDYEETFSPVVKIVTVRCILAHSVQNNWHVYQLDINNAFLYGGLVGDVYMSLPIGYFNKSDKRVRNHLNEVNKVKEFLRSKFLIKDLGKLKYFLGIEVFESDDITQRKYCLELLSEFGILACKPCRTPIEVKTGNVKKNVVILDEPLYMHAPMQSHLKLAFRVLRKSVTGYFVFLGNNLVSWKSKKQFVLAKSFAEAEYRAMNSVTCEIIWIMKNLKELNVKVSLPVTINCDNSSTIQIAANSVFYERTKYFEIESFFLREKVVAGIVKTVKVKSEDNVADVVTKSLSSVDHNKFCRMLKLKYLYHN
uniref:Ribonuclease H-like domain-containing protein n=1 Tax=Tanacetum cinerariifolium TaxID=118510 RepID=A0A699I760_TANCI|nr:ribonuclease H-like domain-containing protein [Tanacetum cinerariifolium]